MSKIADSGGEAAVGMGELRDSFKVGRKNLIVSFGYGLEVPTFARARALWEFYVSHFPNIQTVFMRESSQLRRGEIYHNGYDLLIGTGENRSDDGATGGYASSGVWAAHENHRQIYRQVVFFDYLLRTQEKPFYLYQPSLTSVVDFRGLLAVLEQMPEQECYAGFTNCLPPPSEYAGLVFTSGANSLFSSDMIELICRRYIPGHHHTTQVGDVWDGLVLHDIPRRPLPFFSFMKPRPQGSSHDDVRILTRRLLAEGHFHFRVRTTTADAGLGLREDVDPWIMLRIMEEILASSPVPEANVRMLDRMARAFNATNGTLSSRADLSFFKGPRDFPLNDNEVHITYPDLF